MQFNQYYLKKAFKINRGDEDLRKMFAKIMAMKNHDKDFEN